MNPRLLVFVSVVLAAACGEKGEAPRASAPAPAPVVTGVGVERLAPAKVADFREAVGTVRSRTVSTLSSRLMGNVLTVGAREGDRVEKGRLLITIDARDTRASLAKVEAAMREADEAVAEVERGMDAGTEGIKAAQAQSDLATATRARYAALLEKKSVSRQEFEEVDARAKTARAEVARAEALRAALEAKKPQLAARRAQAAADADLLRVQLSYAEIFAPHAGVVTARSVEPGMMAAPGMGLLTLEAQGGYRLEAAVEESLLSRLKKGDMLKIRIDALGGEERTGRVDEIVPSADPATRTVTVKIALEDQAGLRSGLYGRALVPLGEREGLFVPRAALVERGQLTGVYVVGEGGVASLRLIKTGAETDGRVEVLSGLSAGDAVVVEGAARVTDGARVQ